MLDIGGDMILEALHLRQDSVVVEPGDLIDAGTVLGKVGNTGSYTHPHLHLAVRSRSARNVTVPMALENVRVSLNMAEDCPWTRVFPAGSRKKVISSSGTMATKQLCGTMATKQLCGTMAMSRTKKQVSRKGARLAKESTRTLRFRAFA